MSHTRKVFFRLLRSSLSASSAQNLHSLLLWQETRITGDFFLLSFCEANLIFLISLPALWFRMKNLPSNSIWWGQQRLETSYMMRKECDDGFRAGPSAKERSGNVAARLIQLSDLYCWLTVPRSPTLGCWHDGDSNWRVERRRVGNVIYMKAECDDKI